MPFIELSRNRPNPESQRSLPLWLSATLKILKTRPIQLDYLAGLLLLRQCASIEGKTHLRTFERRLGDFHGAKTHPQARPSASLDPSRHWRSGAIDSFGSVTRRFYTLKIGVPWVDVENKLSPHQVLALCGDQGLLESSTRSCTMGVDTGKELHVVVSRRHDPSGKTTKREVVWIGTAQSYEELDDLVERFQVSRCVIDALPDIHATRQFAARHRGQVWLNYFVEHQKGSAKWDKEQHIVQVNRTEALDSAKKGIRDGEVILPRRIPLIETFANHLASDAKKLFEDEETGAKSYKYLRTGTNHYSLAFTYDWLACEQERRVSSSWSLSPVPDEARPIMYELIQAMRNEGSEWPPRWNKIF